MIMMTQPKAKGYKESRKNCIKNQLNRMPKNITVDEGEESEAQKEKQSRKAGEIS